MNVIEAVEWILVVTLGVVLAMLVISLGAALFKLFDE